MIPIVSPVDSPTKEQGSLYRRLEDFYIAGQGSCLKTLVLRLFICLFNQSHLEAAAEPPQVHMLCPSPSIPRIPFAHIPQPLNPSIRNHESIVLASSTSSNRQAAG
jgi:hypothetical protein